MGDIEAARAWAMERCGPLAVGLQNKRAERGSGYAALWHALKVRRFIDAAGDMRGYQISEEASMYLYRWASVSPDAFDVARDIAYQNVGGGVELVTGLRHFVCSAIGGNFQRPRGRGRARGRNWIRDRLILEILEELVATFDVRPTRNDESDHSNSACDIVLEAFEQAGNYDLSYKVLKSIWLNKTLRKEVARTQQLHAARDQDELPAFVRQNLPPFPVSGN
jgi:hypothetical protein